MFVANVDYGDFCVCIFSENQENDIHIEHIVKDQEFWDDCIIKSQHFFKTCILPELLGKWYTHSNKVYAVSFDTSSSSTTSTDAPVFCYCKGPEEGEMIGCDNEECSIEWFHLDCRYAQFRRGNGIVRTAKIYEEKKFMFNFIQETNNSLKNITS